MKGLFISTSGDQDLRAERSGLGPEGVGVLSSTPAKHGMGSLLWQHVQPGSGCVPERVEPAQPRSGLMGFRDWGLGFRVEGKL